MAKNLTQKIITPHLASGEMVPGQEIALKIDHTLLQDATGTMAMLEFEALGIDSVEVDLAAQYVDHNLLQTDFKNADDHKFLRTACAHYGVHYSEPGNGISHIVHMERFPHVNNEGLAPREQHRRGRHELMSTSFETIERNIRRVEDVPADLLPAGGRVAR